MKTIIKFSVSIVALVFIGYRLEWSAVWESMSKLAWWTLPVATFFQTLAFLIGTIRWHTLLAARGVPYRISQMVQPYFIGSFFNNFLPSATGGDFYRVYHIKSKQHGIADAFSPVITERIIGLATLLLISLVAFTFYEGEAPIIINVAHAAAIFLAGLSVLLTVLGIPAMYWPIHRFLEQQSTNRFLMGILNVSEAMHYYITRPVLFARIVLISALMHSMMITAFWILGQGVGSELSAGSYLLTVPLVLVSAGIPITIGGLGVREATGIALFTSVGMIPADAAVVAILFIPTLLLSSLPGLFFFLARKHDRSIQDQAK